MLRRHFTMYANNSNENIYGYYDWCVKYIATERIYPFGAPLKDIEAFYKSNGSTITNTNYTWINEDTSGNITTGDLINLTYDVWDPITGEGTLGFIGTLPAIFGTMFEIINSNGESSKSYLGFNSFDIKTGQCKQDYSIIKIECPTNVHILLNLMCFQLSCIVHSLEDYIFPSNCDFHTTFFSNIALDAPYMQKPFIFKSNWTADVTNLNPYYFPHDMARAYSFIVEEGNLKYDSRDNCGCIISTDNNCLLVGSKTGFIPNSIVILGTSCFYSSRVTTINIPNSVININAGAFYNCSSLTSVTIPNSVTYISQHAFGACSGLTEILYLGTIEQWNNISLDSGAFETGVTIKCIDGDVII